MKFLIFCAFAAALLAVANVNGLPVIPCQFAYEYIPDDYDCTVYYICNSELWPVEYQCAGLECWDQSSKICTTNRIACGCPVTGESADEMYFVEDGIVVISVVEELAVILFDVAYRNVIDFNFIYQTVHTLRAASRICKGGYFGELPLVTHKPRAASASAVIKVKLGFLDVQAFERLLGSCMDIMKRNIEDYEEQFAKIFGP
ncbi:cAMP-dependent protein kinase type II regulatory subunit [Chamberlinius hualienensis]